MRQFLERYRYAAAVFVLAVAVFATLLLLHQYKTTFLDLKAFACAGRAFAQGADPYRDAIVRPCEVALATNVFAGSSGFDQPTVPVPWPPYAMPLLVPLGLLPFGAGAIATVEPARTPLPAATMASNSRPAGCPSAASVGTPANTTNAAIATGESCGSERRSTSAAIAKQPKLNNVQAIAAAPNGSAPNSPSSGMAYGGQGTGTVG